MDCLQINGYVDEDIEMMETDDISDNVFPNKRKLNSVIETTVVSNLGNKSPKSQSTPQLRPVLKARRHLPKMPSLEVKESLDFSVTIDEKLKPICVLDTNILLSNLTELKNVILIEEKLRQTTKKSKLRSFVIPWIVVQELDRMKTRKLDKSVVNVIHFLNEQLKKSNGLIRGENDFISKFNSNSIKTIERIEEEVNDDKIINCCLKMKTIPESNVILITNDVNLCNKGLMNHLKAIDWNDFFGKYKASDLHFDETISEDSDQTEPQIKRFAKNHTKTSDNSVPYISSSFNQSNRQLKTTLSPKTVPKLSTSSKTSSQSVRRLKSPNKRKSSLGSPPKTPQSSDLSDNSKTVSDESDLKYDDWIRFKDECEQKLLKFTERVYRDIWENDWKKMLELDVNNTNLKQIIRVMRKEWNSNFSDHFNRDKTIRGLIDSIHSNLLKSATNYRLYYSHLKRFVDLIERKYKEIIKEDKNRKTI